LPSWDDALPLGLGLPLPDLPREHRPRERRGRLADLDPRARRGRNLHGDRHAQEAGHEGRSPRGPEQPL